MKHRRVPAQLSAPRFWLGYFLALAASNAIAICAVATLASVGLDGSIVLFDSVVSIQIILPAGCVICGLSSINFAKGRDKSPGYGYIMLCAGSLWFIISAFTLAFLGGTSWAHHDLIEEHQMGAALLVASLLCVSFFVFVRAQDAVDEENRGIGRT